MPLAEPETVSERALERGKQQLGTLGSGNHFLEIQVVDCIYNKPIASKLGINIGDITAMIHTGSRGLGYQVCEDYLKLMLQASEKYKIRLPDKQLCCAPINSKEAQQYIKAMSSAANYAWANRQMITYLTRKTFEETFAKKWQDLGMRLIYDVAHNIAKFEDYSIEGKIKKLSVHSKGATRAFGPNNPHLNQDYQNIGQPVIIPGDMGSASYLLIGTQKAEEETFSSTCHGAGRVKSRHQSIKTTDFNKLMQELSSKDILIKAAGKRAILEEAPSAYKDIDEVVKVVDEAGLAKKICRMRPIAVIKG